MFAATLISKKSLFTLNAVVLLSSVQLPTVISLCAHLGKKSEIPWKSPNPGNCNEGVARLRSIGPIVDSCMDSMVLQGASMTHNAPCIPLLFRIVEGEWGVAHNFLFHDLVCRNLNPTHLFTLKISMNSRKKKQLSFSNFLCKKF